MLVADSTRLRKSTSIDLATELAVLAQLDAVAPDDFSPQRLISLMAERNGKPTLFRRDEFGGFYDGLNKLEHQAGGKQVLIVFHDGRGYRKELQGQTEKDRETGEVKRLPEVIQVTEPFLSILAGTQRDLFLSQAPTADIFSGFLPRFAFIVPGIHRQRKDVAELDDAIEQKRDSLVGELKALQAKPTRDMYLTEGVLERWNRYAADLEQEAESASVPSIAGPVFDRHGVMAFRIALLYSLQDGDAMTMDHMLAGIEVAERWRPQGYQLLSAIGPSREEKTFQRVTDLVARRPGIQRRDVMSSLRLSARDMDAAHNTLTQRGWIRAAEYGKGTAYSPLQVSALASFERLSGDSFSSRPEGSLGSNGPEEPIEADESPDKHASASSEGLGMWEEEL